MSEKISYKGLSASQVEESRKKYGANVITPPPRVSRWKLFLEKFSDPLISILLVIGVLAVGVSCYEYWGLGEEPKVFFDPIGIFIAIFLATGLGFYFELKAQKEFTILNQANDHERVAVVRDGNVTEIPKCDVVVGDILVLQTGEEIPADARLLEAASLIVDESSLTGEPAHEKHVGEADADAESTYPADKVYRGTQLFEGHGIAEVFAVGDNTENGRIMQSLQGVEYDSRMAEASEGLNETQRIAAQLEKRGRVSRGVKTPLSEQLDRLGRRISDMSYAIAAAIIMGRLLVYFDWAWQVSFLLVPTALFFWLVVKHFPHMSRWKCLSCIAVFFVIFIASVVALHHLLLPTLELSHLLAYALETVMIAVTLVVVAVPEGLPMAISLALARSMRKMLKTNNLVRRMHACETMGATTVICTDKTGTLTQNLMQVSSVMMDESPAVFEGVAANSTASLDFSQTPPHVIGNPTEGALLLWLREKGKNYRELRQSTTRLQELPFSTERKYMATLVLSAAVPGRKVLYVKGAPEIVMAMCRKTEGGHTFADYEKTLTELQTKAMRTLGFAYQVTDDDAVVIENGKVVADGLVFSGIVGIQDLVRSDVGEAVAKCVGAGISIKIVTGDTKATACEIGRQIGVFNDSDAENGVIDGSDFAALSWEELTERVDDLKIIARARPMDKKRLVEVLQEKGHVVAVTGDGTNDAPALNAAHVGLSMGSGTGVAKEASDITIIDNSFASIVRAVMWGRSLFQNIRRFLLFQLTVNVSACLLVLCGAFMGTESPLTVTQMLWVNLIMDTFAAFALSGLPPSERVMSEPPRNRKAFIIDRDMMGNIVGVGVFFFLLSFLLLYVFQHADIKSLADLLTLSLGKKGSVTPYEQTLLFTVFVMTHFWYLFNSRAYNSGGSGLNMKGCDGFVGIALLVFFGQIAIVQLPVLAPFFNAVSLQISDWLVIICLSSLVVIVREVNAVIRRKVKASS